VRKKIIRIFLVILALAVPFGVYTNCAPLETDNPQSNSKSEMDLSSNNIELSEKIDVTGWGITRDISSDCPAYDFNDFMEQAASHAKRVEPRDCVKIKISTPIISWARPSDLMVGTGYTLLLSSQSSSSSFTPRTYSNLSATRFFVSAPLPAGKYKWSVTYKNRINQTVPSQERRFEVPSGAFAIPSGETFATAVLAKSHPRIQPNEGSNPSNKVPWSSVITRARSFGYSAAFNQFFLTQLNTSVGHRLPALRVSRNQMLALKTAIVNMAYGFHFWNDVAYFNKTKVLLEGLVQWPLNCAIDSDSEDQVNREIHSILAISLDLFQQKLNESANIPLRDRMVTVLKQRLALVNFNTLNGYPYDSHLLSGAIYSLESMMYAASTPGFATDQGRSELIRLWNNAITTFGTWGGTIDGGWANGGGYGWYAADLYVRFLAVTKLMANLDLTRWPALGQFGYNQLYFTAPLNVTRQQFGDEADATNHYQQYSDDTLRLFALVTRKPEYEWYWRVRGETAVNNKFMWNPLHFMLVAASPTAPSFPTWDTSHLPRSILFEDAGVVAMHSDPGQADRTSVYFRSSRFGSFNHSHADQNAFTFVSKGKDMLISGGIYDSYITDYHARITRATRFKNALTFDNGIGQAEPMENPTAPGAPIKSLMDFSGKIINYSDDGTWAVTTGDATNAYRGMDLNVGRAIPFVAGAYRTVAYNRQQGVVLIYDWARSATPRRWELNFHTLQSNSPAIAGPGQTIKLENATTKACLRVWTSASIPFYFDPFTTGWEGLLPKTDIGRPIHPEVHMRLNVRQKSQEFTAVTVINEGCRNIPIEVTFNGSEAYANVNGSRMTMNGRVAKNP